MNQEQFPRAVLVTGGTGFLGRHVIRALRQRGAAVWVWTRDAERARRVLGEGVHVVSELARIPADAPIEAIVNLAGAPVVGPPWTAARRRVLIDSRVVTTQAVIAWCATRAARPRVIVSASAIGFYGAAGETLLDESSPPQERQFQSRLCVERERAADEARGLGLRVVNLRIGLVLGPDGGILTRLALAARLGVAAVIANGRQWMSWVHVDDFVSVVLLALTDADFSGAVNAVAPDPVRQRDFQRALTWSLRRPLLLWIPGFALRLALGEMSELLTRSQRVAPRRLLELGFRFAHPRLEPALPTLLRRARS